MGMAVDRRAARLGVLGLVGMLLFSLLGARLWFLQTVRADDLQDSVTVSKTRTVQVPPERGRIFDIDGRILADNERVLTVAVDWQMLRRKTQRTEIFTRVSGWLDVPVEEMEARFQRGIDSPFLPFPLKRDVDEETAAAILERSEDFPGVEILNEWDRVYPYAPHAAHVVGYMGAIQAEQVEEYQAQGYLLSERVGQFGVERELEEVLHGQGGELTYEVDAANRPIRVVEESAETALLRGEVVDSTYFGAGSQMLVRLEDGVSVHVQVSTPRPVGSRVGLECDTSMLHVLED